MALPGVFPHVAAERLKLALYAGAGGKPDLNAIRDALVAYVNQLPSSGATVTETIVDVRTMVRQFSSQQEPERAALVDQVVTWSIDEYYTAQDK